MVYLTEETQGEKTLPDKRGPFIRVVLGIILFGESPWTNPELLFEEKGMISAVQQLLVSWLDKIPQK